MQTTAAMLNAYKTPNPLPPFYQINKNSGGLLFLLCLTVFRWPIPAGLPSTQYNLTWAKEEKSLPPPFNFFQIRGDDLCALLIALRKIYNNPLFRKKFFAMTFVISILWIMVFSYLMVWWTTVVGNYAGNLIIPI